MRLGTLNGDFKAFYAILLGVFYEIERCDSFGFEWSDFRSFPTLTEVSIDCRKVSLACEGSFLAFFLKKVFCLYDFEIWGPGL